MIYKIWVEDRGDTSLVSRIVGERFKGFSILSAVGIWEGKREASLCIEIDSLGENCYRQVLEVAERLRVVFNQQAVLVQRLESASVLVDGSK